jgi:bacterioferritin-associated ferredoxin
MYICLCNSVTDKQIRSAIAGGATSLRCLRDELGVASQCGSCLDHALQLLDGQDPLGAQLDTQLDKDLAYSVA